MSNDQPQFTVMANLLHAQRTLTGTGRYARDLVRALVAMPGGPRVIGVVSPANADAWGIPVGPRYRQVIWGRGWTSVMARRAEEWIFLDGLVRRVRPTVFWGPSNFLPWTRRGPMVATIHDATFFQNPGYLPPLRRAYWLRWSRRTARIADAVLTVSESAKADLLEHLPLDPGRVRVVYNGADPSFFIADDLAGRAERKRALHERFPTLPPTYLSFVGTLTEHKNVPRLVEAVARARNQGCGDIHLVLAGKRGHGYDKVAAAVERGHLAGRVHELGFVEDEFLPALYENARAHVLPSFTEGFGLPIIESMACGTPVLASGRGAMAEVAAQAAITFNPVDIESMAAAVARIWRNDADWREYRRLGIERAASFTWQRAARETFEVFQQVAAANA